MPWSELDLLVATTIGRWALVRASWQAPNQIGEVEVLELRPNCEYCDKDLPPTALDARICSYECTFCAHCVETILHNVCPNCGGGFVRRPTRPSTERRQGVSLTHHPASTKRVHLRYERDEVARFAAHHKDVPPELR